MHFQLNRYENVPCLLNELFWGTKLLVTESCEIEIKWHKCWKRKLKHSSICSITPGLCLLAKYSRVFSFSPFFHFLATNKRTSVFCFLNVRRTLFDYNFLKGMEAMKEKKSFFSWKHTSFFLRLLLTVVVAVSIRVPIILLFFIASLFFLNIWFFHFFTFLKVIK